MVRDLIEVDIFWAYALGAMFAAAAARQIKQLKEDDSIESKFNNKYIVTIILYMALFFGPSGLYLLWAFPHWESMQVFWTHSQIPAWFAIMFGITNVTNGILGYFVVRWLAKQERYYEANLQWVIGYFCMFFVLVYGWDGTGWQRFLYDATITGIPWTPGVHMGFAWLTSNVAITLLVMGIMILPPLFIIASKWVAQSAEFEPDAKKKENIPKSRLLILVVALLGALGVGLGSAYAAAAISQLFKFILLPSMVWWLAGLVGGIIGLIVFMVPMWIFVFRRGQLLNKVFEKYGFG